MVNLVFAKMVMRFLLLSVLLCLVSIPAQAGWWPFGEKGMDYTIIIEGVDSETLAWFNTLKLTQKNEQHPPETMEDLEQESGSLEQRLNLALKAHGYYEAQIDVRLDKNAVPPLLHYSITPGPRTLISHVALEWQGGEIPDIRTDHLKLQAGDAMDADAVGVDAVTLRDAVGKDTCLLSLSVHPVLRVDEKTHDAVLVYQIKHGPRANFGTVKITGTRRTRPAAVERYLTFKRGECFTAAKIESSQAALFGSQLFASVDITPANGVDGHGEAPVRVNVKERASHTLSAGANYATDKGVGFKGGWEDRNFSGGGEKVNAGATLAEQEQSLTLTERIPGFRRDDQTLNLTGGVTHEDTDAYTSNAFNVSAGLERRLSKTLNGGLGIGYDLKRTDDVRNGAQSYSLISLPLFAEYETRDNATDARRGIFARLNATPYQDMLDPSLHFLKTTLTGQTYFSSDVFWKPTLALRGSIGSIAGSSYHDLPADLRYYAGGGGSVRGYAYQSLSPRLNGQSIGGGSLLEFSAEGRLRFTDTIGGVAFLDAGNAYDSSFPGAGKLYYGTGVGARYYSAIGPIRLDVGVPINRGDVDTGAYQLYVSIGQAF